MPTELHMVFDGRGLVPSNPMSEEDMQRLKRGREYTVKISQPRTQQQMKFVRGLAAKVADACDWLPDAAAATDYLKLKARFYKIVTNKEKDLTFLMPKSYTDLDKEEFSRLIDRMIYVVCSEIIPGLERGKLRREIEKMVGIADPEPAEVRHTSNGPDGEGARQVTPRPQTP